LLYSYGEIEEQLAADGKHRRSLRKRALVK
jgi:hypothetical protein